MNTTRRRSAALVTLAAVALLLMAAGAGLAVVHFAGQLERAASGPNKSTSAAMATATPA